MLEGWGGAGRIPQPAATGACTCVSSSSHANARQEPLLSSVYVFLSSQHPQRKLYVVPILQMVKLRLRSTAPKWPSQGLNLAQLTVTYND